MVDEETPLLCKALWVSRKALYKCNELLIIIIIIKFFLFLTKKGIFGREHFKAPQQ